MDSNHSAKTNNKLLIGTNCKLSISDIKNFLAKNLSLDLSPESHISITRSFQFLQSCVDQHIPIYGVTTSFGDQVKYLDFNLFKNNKNDYYETIVRRQKQIIRSLACGLGDAVSTDIVRVTMLLRAHCLAQGYSGVSADTLTALLSYINANVTPVVYQYGSIGASGDLIPLGTIASALIGENIDVIYQNKILKAPQAMELTGIKKLIPQLRDGLALINGTCFMTAIAALTLHELKRIFKQMLIAIAMSLEAMLVISSAYQPIVHQLKHHKGEYQVNQFLLDFWHGSQLLTDLDELRHFTTDLHETQSRRAIQDYYSLRAVPQGFGPFQENLDRATLWIEDEMNSINDNPIVDIAQQKIHHTANFMGYYITEACDLLKIDIAQASTWLHALLANLVHPRKSHGLPTNIVSDPGINNGFRSIQLLADALAIQNRKLAQSHQAFMLPTEGDNQDVNSLGTHAAFDFQESVTNLERLTALLLLSATQALELRGIEKAGKKSQAIYHIIRQHSPTLVECRPMTHEINTIISLLREEKV